VTYNPPPYQPPPPGPLGYAPQQPGFADSLAPARRAAIMCWVLGGLGLLCGLCLNGVAFLAPLDTLADEFRRSVPPEQLKALGNIDLTQALKIGYALIGIVTLLISIVLLILGGFIRRGGRGSIITGLVIYIALALACALVVLVGLIQAVTVSPTALAAVVIWLVIGAAVAVTIHWLVQALRAGGAAAQQLQAYYWQLQQQQQAMQQPYGQGYGYGGYGYGAPAPQSNVPPPAAPQQSLGPMPPPPGSSDSGPAPERPKQGE
jgi:hypothetical protein